MGKGSTLHPIVKDAARGRLPDWARAGEGRRKHMARVAELLESWASDLGLNGSKRARWVSLGYLHDALRDAPPKELMDLVPPGIRSLPESLYHGPATAARLKEEGVKDGKLLRAIACHTLGHPKLSRMGRALYAADFLEPGRKRRRRWRRRLRRRMPEELDEVVLEILEERVKFLASKKARLRTETLRFLIAMRERDGG